MGNFRTILTIQNIRQLMEFWEEAFKDKQEMWGFEPARSTILTRNFYIEHNVKSALSMDESAQIFMAK